MSDWIRVHDNGIRSYIPPAFSWDLIEDGTERNIDTVSEFDLSRLGLTNDESLELLDEITRGDTLVKGTVAETEPHQPSGQRGKVLAVTEVSKR